MTTVNIARIRALRRIDAAAGEARLRYITDVPGQQAVYMVKLEEARALLADPNATPGPHLVAEAAARGITALAMAEMVDDLASVWTGVLSPAIEAARMAGKLAVDGASDEDEVETATQAAIAALNAL